VLPDSLDLVSFLSQGQNEAAVARKNTGVEKEFKAVTILCYEQKFSIRSIQFLATVLHGSSPYLPACFIGGEGVNLLVILLPLCWSGV
jgi:hypothetical protein